jgi:hypothetical protein
MRDTVSVLSTADSAKFNRGSFAFEMQAVEPRRENVPDTPECARFRHAPIAPPVVCLTELSDPNGGEACATTARIRSGRAFIVEDRIPGARAGTARIFGIAPDGVKSVRLTFRGRPAETDAVENVQVIDNAFAFEYNGSAAVPPTVELIPRTAE